MNLLLGRGNVWFRQKGRSILEMLFLPINIPRPTPDVVAVLSPRAHDGVVLVGTALLIGLELGPRRMAVVTSCSSRKDSLGVD